MKEIKLVKPRAKTEIRFKPDKEDDWFIHIETIEKKSGKKTSKMITQKDVEIYLKGYIDKGWVVFK